jgi:hypothetical protein
VRPASTFDASGRPPAKHGRPQALTRSAQLPVGPQRAATPQWDESDDFDAMCARNPHVLVNVKMLHGITKVFFDFMQKSNEKNRERNARIEALETRVTALEGGVGPHERGVDVEARIRALEERPVMHYKGVWVEGTTYAPGSVVTNGGSMWYANTSTRSEPGQGHSRDWTLCVKRGREGRPRGEK